MHLLEFSQIEWILMGTTAMLFIILLFYCLFFYSSPFRRNKQEGVMKRKYDKLPPVSVILYSQDDAKRVEEHLPAFMNQDYPDFEVIVVADEAGEECANALSLMKGQYERLRISFVPNKVKFICRKKLALTLGIKAAHHDLLLFSDLDVEPVGKDWLNEMVDSYQKQTQMVIGVSSYPYIRGWRNKLIGLDNLRHTLQFLTAAIHHHPFDGTGKNLSYTKSLFFQYKGFYHQLHLKVGDDSLFIDEAATADNSAVCYDAKALVKRDEVRSMKEWTRERGAKMAIRGLSKNKYYYLFKIETFLYLLFIAAELALLGIGMVSNYLLLLLSCLLMLFYYGAKTMVFVRRARLLSQQIKWYNFMIIDFANNLYVAYLTLFSRFVRKRDYVFVVEK